MSDILKKAKEKERKAKQEKEGKAVTEVVAPRALAYEIKKPKVEQQPEVKEQEKEEAEISEVRISPVVMKGTKVASSEENLKLYEESVSLVREILKENINRKPVDTKRIIAQIEKIAEQLSLGNEKLLELSLIKDSKDENYLLCHSVNVCIYSIITGLALDYEKSKLIELGTSALLHDVGMSEYLHLSNQPRKLTAREYDEIKNHPINGSKILEKVENLNKIAICVCSQQHERIDGLGYPKGLKGESINEYAKIVGLVDVFEAMIHPRAYRNEFLPLEALRIILTNKNGFEYKLIKILIEKIGVFPIGSLVELNIQRIAQVVKLNHTVPLRPVVKVIYEADGKEPEEMKIIDLTTQPTIYIKKAVRKSELFESVPSL